VQTKKKMEELDTIDLFNLWLIDEDPEIEQHADPLLWEILMREYKQDQKDQHNEESNKQDI
tara:strand:+ start:1832 stop:2014 length:183 start_codon:yes stop_codon:yes gene_type:complete